jgi:hypothetical protein
MPRPTFRILAYLALALAPFASAADAGVGDTSGALSSFGRLSPMQTVQYGGDDCWYDNGWNGPGYYPCGNEWSNGLGGAGPGSSILVPAIRRHHRHGVVVAHPKAANPIYPGAPSRRLGVGAPAGGVRVTPNFHAGSPAVTPGFAGGGFHGGVGGGNFHQFHGAGFPHIGAPPSSGSAGIGTFHASGVGAPHIGAPATPGFAGGGFHGVGGVGAFQGGAGFGQGGIGHR